MKLRLLAVAAALALAAPAFGATPSITARAYVVEDGASGAILLASNDRERVPIASITKLMTVLVALEHARPDDVVVVDAGAASVGESTVNLRAGERLTVRDLVKAALIQSANDAAYALAAHVGGGSVERFVSMMNERARRLGLTDTHFVRPDGLDAAGHVSSARDVTRLARVAMRNPEIRAAVGERSDTIAGGRTLHTWNDLLSTFPGVLGVKTGHTSAAGWSQVVAALGAYATVYATILGGPSRNERNADLVELLRWGLDRYRLAAAVSASRAYARARAPYGRHELALVAPRALLRVVRLGRPLVEHVVAPDAIELPVRRGQRLGEVRVYDDGKLVARSPLVASRSIARPGLGGRVGWYAGRAVDHVRGWVS